MLLKGRRAGTANLSKLSLSDVERIEGVQEYTRFPAPAPPTPMCCCSRARSAITVSRSEFLIPGAPTFDGIESLARWISQKGQG